MGDYFIVALRQGENQTYHWSFMELGVTPLIKGRNTEETKKLNRVTIDRVRDTIAGRMPTSKTALFSTPTSAEPDSVAYQVGDGVGVNTGEGFWIIGNNFYHEGNPADSLMLLAPADKLLWDGSAHNGLSIYWNTGILMQLNHSTGNGVGSGPIILRKVAEGQEAINYDWPNAPVLNVDFNYRNSYIQSGSLVYEYDFTNLALPQGEALQDAEDALDAAMATWNAVSGVNFSQGVSSHKIQWSTSSSDMWAQNSVSSLDGYVVGSQIVFYAGNNDFSTIPLSGHGDIESIALHELGHSLALGHVTGGGTWNQDKIMFFALSDGVQKRTLHAGDGRGAIWIYGP